MQDTLKVTTKPFSDVDVDAWYAEPIAFMKEFGIINGYEDGTFKPGKNLTRAETVVIVNRMLERAMSDYSVKTLVVPLKDMDKTHWAYADVLESVVEHDYSIGADGEEVVTNYKY